MISGRVVPLTLGSLSSETGKKSLKSTAEAETREDGGMVATMCRQMLKNFLSPYLEFIFRCITVVMYQLEDTVHR